MAGGTFLPGQTKILPGIYFYPTGVSSPTTPGVTSGIVAAVFAATWGPTGAAQTLNVLGDVDVRYGTGLGTDAAREAFIGGANKVLALRAGAGAVKATKTLVDTTGSPVNVVRLTTTQPGTRGNNFKVTLADSTSDSTKRILSLYEGTMLLETFQFPKGGTSEIDDLVASVNGGSGLWIVAAKLAAGNNVMAAISVAAAFGAGSDTAGTDPTVAGTDYSNAMALIEATDYNILVLDSESNTIHSTYLDPYMIRCLGEGKRILAVVGEPTSVSLATRQADAAAHNSKTIQYVGNGIVDSQGTKEGFRAAGRYAGMLAAAPLRNSMTNTPVPFATSIKNADGELTTAQKETCVQRGMVLFDLSTSGSPKVLYGVNTLVTPAAGEDDGWKKTKRVRIRFNLMDRLAAAWEPLIGRINNDSIGKSTVVSTGQTVFNQMIQENLLGPASTIAIDASQPVTGDRIYLKTVIYDIDSLEFVYDTAVFNFNSPA